ncbi:hypothetical protein OG783_33640 (plasmid) [Streptomyces jietaisiensis]|uniref:hypothetical protein n=1 Tax=Streptomyces griseoaurantiacus TaxID=68213 RepID=UPI002F910681
MAHYQRRLLEINKGSTLDEETWRLTTPAIAQAGVVSLLGLPDRVVGEVLYGLQERVVAGIRHKDHHVRPFCDLLRTRGRLAGRTRRLRPGEDERRAGEGVPQARRPAEHVAGN